MAVGGHDVLARGEGAHQHHEGGAGHVEVRYADAGLIVCHCRSGRPSVRFETAAGEEKRCRVDDRSRRFQFDDGPGYQTQSFGKS